MADTAVDTEDKAVAKAMFCPEPCKTEKQTATITEQLSQIRTKKSNSNTKTVAGMVLWRRGLLHCLGYPPPRSQCKFKSSAARGETADDGSDA